MTTEKIFEVVREELCASHTDKLGNPIFTLEQLTEDTNLIELGFDSLDLAMSIEAMALRFNKDAGELWEAVVNQMTLAHSSSLRAIVRALEGMLA